MFDSACDFSHKQWCILCAYIQVILASVDFLRELICILDSQQMRVFFVREFLCMADSQQMGVFICHACTDHKVSATVVTP